LPDLGLVPAHDVAGRVERVVLATGVDADGHRIEGTVARRGSGARKADKTGVVPSFACRAPACRHIGGHEHGKTVPTPSLADEGRPAELALDPLVQET
jgi:hypothetical protein